MTMAAVFRRLVAPHCADADAATLWQAYRRRVIAQRDVGKLLLGKAEENRQQRIVSLALSASASEFASSSVAATDPAALAPLNKSTIAEEGDEVEAEVEVDEKNEEGSSNISQSTSSSSQDQEYPDQRQQNPKNELDYQSQPYQPYQPYQPTLAEQRLIDEELDMIERDLYMDRFDPVGKRRRQLRANLEQQGPWTQLGSSSDSGNARSGNAAASSSSLHKSTAAGASGAGAGVSEQSNSKAGSSNSISASASASPAVSVDELIGKCPSLASDVARALKDRILVISSYANPTDESHDDSEGDDDSDDGDEDEDDDGDERAAVEKEGEGFRYLGDGIDYYNGLVGNNVDESVDGVTFELGIDKEGSSQRGGERGSGEDEDEAFSYAMQPDQHGDTISEPISSSSSTSSSSSSSLPFSMGDFISGGIEISPALLMRSRNNNDEIIISKQPEDDWSYAAVAEVSRLYRAGPVIYLRPRHHLPSDHPSVLGDDDDTAPRRPREYENDPGDSDDHSGKNVLTTTTTTSAATEIEIGDINISGDDSISSSISNSDINANSKQEISTNMNINGNSNSNSISSKNQSNSIIDDSNNSNSSYYRKKKGKNARKKRAMERLQKREVELDGAAASVDLVTGGRRVEPLIVEDRLVWPESVRERHRELARIISDWLDMLVVFGYL